MENVYGVNRGVVRPWVVRREKRWDMSFVRQTNSYLDRDKMSPSGTALRSLGESRGGYLIPVWYEGADFLDEKG